MTYYKCTGSFTDKSGKKYSAGDKIDGSAYNALSLSHQTNFRKEDNYFSPLANASNQMMGDMLGSGLPGGYDLDTTTPW